MLNGLIDKLTTKHLGYLGFLGLLAPLTMVTGNPTFIGFSLFGLFGLFALLGDGKNSTNSMSMRFGALMAAAMMVAVGALVVWAVGR
jgi:hypothetical protein